MICTGCGLVGRMYEAACESCGRRLREPAEAEAKRREWEALSPALREEFERDYLRQRRAWAEHADWRRRHRRLHVLGAAGVVAVAMDLPMALPSLWAVLIHLAIGAAGALLLHRWGGGAYRGLILFAGVGVGALLSLFPFIDLVLFAQGGWLIAPFCVHAVAAYGFYLGGKLEGEFVER